ncbi:ATP-binding protein [Chloroflexota bacterium]
MIMPELVSELCNGCGLCIAACHGGGIVISQGIVKIVETECCDFCGVCEAVCPFYAIRCPYCIIYTDLNQQ